MSDYDWLYPTDQDRRLVLLADAEQAKSTGGMLALSLRSDFADQLAVPGGEPVEDLHLTLVYFGEDVTDSPGEDSIARAVSGIADQYSAVDARVMSHATFNPDGGADGDRDPCAVYIVSDSADLDDLHDDVAQAVAPFTSTEQHRPWLPHVTAGYGLDASNLSFTGDVIFDRLVFKWAGREYTFALGG